MEKLSIFLADIFHSRRLILELAKNDFKMKYASSYLGIIWSFIQPITTILTFWFVFQLGFRSQPVEGFPFILWLIGGMIPWFFFQDAMINGTNALMEYSYLVKKVLFKISILPVVKILSNLFVHLFFVAFMLLIYMAYGYMPDLYWLQLIYYLICLIALIVGAVFITSSVVVFFTDLSPLISVVLQFTMWMTPIMWSINNIPATFGKVLAILKINPMYYIVQGYRDCLINKVWFFERGADSIRFWIITLLIIGAGFLLFKKLKPHFADVL